LIEPLQELDYNIIAIDAPAHGDSTGETITAVMYSEVISTVSQLYEPQIVVAHSMGAMAFAYQQSSHQHDFIKKIVMLGSPDTLEVILQGYQELTGFSDGAYKSLNAYIEDKFGLAVEEFATSKFVQKIDTPTLLVHSKEDRIVGYECMSNIAAQMPNAVTYTSQSGGHSLHTPEVVERIKEFLTSN
jgi:pimeloyl-ACP methyl ester carboxylesterase